jgi:hypothetical protein
MKQISVVATTLLLGSVTAEQVSNRRQLTDQRYKFLWPECSIPDHELSAKACQAVIEGDLEFNLLENVEVVIKRDEEEQAAQPNNTVQIWTNSMDQVIGKDFTSGLVEYPFLWNGHPTGPWNCMGRNHLQCCRMIQRRAGTNEEGKELQCQRKMTHPSAVIRQGLQDQVLWEEYRFEEHAQQIQLLFVDEPETIELEIHAAADDKVYQAPSLNARLELNPASEFLGSFVQKDGQDGMTTYSEMSILSPDITLDETWWYSMPVIVAFLTVCACSGFLFYMCCIPVVPEEDLEDDDCHHHHHGRPPLQHVQTSAAKVV